MKKEEILTYYDDLYRLALSKCADRFEAEDLVQDTVLAALNYLAGGGEIEHPKSWLVSTLMHKFNSMLRDRYKKPTILQYEGLNAAAAEEEPDFLSADEEAAVRRELNYLAKTMRAVLVRYYYYGESVQKIAGDLKIPEGTVKSRLSTGRGQIKKGLESMEQQHKDHPIPMSMWISWAGAGGPRSWIVHEDLIAQNLLILAYEKPLTASELARRIGIPTVYVEPILQRLVRNEFMVRTDGDRYYTDFILHMPGDDLKNFDREKQFAADHFEKDWAVIEEMLAKIRELPFFTSLNIRQQKKLERFAVMNALEQLKDHATHLDRNYPERQSGGSWWAHGYVSQPEHSTTEKENDAWHHTVGGLRTHQEQSADGKTRLTLYEYDTAYCDSSCRYKVYKGGGLMGGYGVQLLKLLWCTKSGKSPEEEGVSESMLESIPGFIEVGILAKDDSGGLIADIPVLEEKTESQPVEACVNWAVKQLIEQSGEELTAFVKSTLLPIPGHLKSVPDFLRASVSHLVMAYVYIAINKGLHLNDTDFICPPVIMTHGAIE